MAYDILIVDDEDDIRVQIAGVLEDEGYETRQAATSDEVLEAVKMRQPSLIILDVWLADSQLDGIKILEEVKKHNPDVPVIMISGHGTVDMAVSATKKGAYDFISKPFNSDALLHTMKRALEEVKLRLQNRQFSKLSSGEEVIGTSVIVQELRQEIEKISGTSARVLISGPTGTGKSVVARTIYRQSLRANMAFIIFSCAHQDEDRIRNELFGIEAKGQSPRIVGALEQAHGGTIVLDEITDIPLEIQKELVKMLHKQSFLRQGGGQPVDIDVRIISTTRQDLLTCIKEGVFREDLFYRLGVKHIKLEPLSRRKEDVPLLSEHFMTLFAMAKGRVPLSFSNDAKVALQAQRWERNGWDVSSIVEKLLLTGTPGQEITAQGVSHAIGSANQDEETLISQDAKWLSCPLRDARKAFERHYLLFNLERFSGNISRTAHFIGMDRAALHRKLKDLEVELPR